MHQHQRAQATDQVADVVRCSAIDCAANETSNNDVSNIYLQSRVDSVGWHAYVRHFIACREQLHYF